VLDFKRFSHSSVSRHFELNSLERSMASRVVKRSAVRRTKTGGKSGAFKKLAKYRAKRDFSKTAEPSGSAKARADKHRRFVIQKHDATRLHYDLRLEYDGVFKSWAVTRGPSLDPNDKRLAVEVEDHPLDYGDFEGTIPKGQYGGGTVQLWDRGYWTSDDPERGFKKGDLKFTLEGEKLHGGWVLVRMRRKNGEKRTNWLLIKHRDADARKGRANDVLDHDQSVASGRSMDAIAAGKGRAPKPFIAAKSKFAADATYQSKAANRQPATMDETVAAPRKAKATTEKSSKGKSKSKRSTKAQPKSNEERAPPHFVAPQLCRLVERAPSETGWVHEVKFDGYRMQLRVAENVTLKTRTGLDWSDKFPAIVKVAAALPDCLIDGEMVALNPEGQPRFADLQAALSEGNTNNLIFFAFDLLFAAGHDLRALSLLERKEMLHTMLSKVFPADDVRIRYVMHLGEPGDAVWESACRMSLEGIVSKQADAPYQSGRSDAWLKIKCRAGHEVVLGGWKSNGDKFRSLLAGVYDQDDTLVYVGTIGTGFGRDTVRKLMPKLKETASSDNPFGGATAPRKAAGVHWLAPELVAEIEFAGWTGAGNIRQAAFKGLRFDKSARDVTADRPVPPEDIDVVSPDAALGKSAKIVAKNRTKTRAKTKDAKAGLSKAKNNKPNNKTNKSPVVEKTTTPDVVMGVTISHPDKVLWPKSKNGKHGEAISKIDLAHYYESVGDWLIPHIKGRPCSIIRTPDGIDAETFFQRHAMKGMSDLLGLVTVSGDRKPYVQIDRIEGLAAVAQWAGVELHPWNNQPDAPMVPGRLVFDLDPAPDVAFSAVITAAMEMRERLDHLGLVSFCKTTGGKGLHVVTPLARPKKSQQLTWPEAKAFAREVCEAMASDSPSKYLINMSKAQRKGRIFLDYLRNDRMATAVAPLSPRARDGAPVSMPLTWTQVRSGLDPAKFNIHTAAALLKKTKPWQDYADGARVLSKAGVK
jgi:bifunctional non-homologous end joining protein LigD